MNLSLILISQYLFAASYQNIIEIVYAKILYVSTYVNNYLNDSYHCGTSYAAMYDCINADMFIHFNFNHGIVDSN